MVDEDLKDYNGTYGQRLFHQKLGFIASANFYQNNRGSQDQEPAYTNPTTVASLDLRDYVLTRTRKGGTWDVDYRLSPGSEIFVRGLRTEYEDSELRHRFRELISNSRLERLLRNRYHDSNQTALSIGGTHPLPDSLLLSWRGGYSNAVLDTPYRLENTFRQTGVTFTPNTANSIDPNNIQPNPQNQNLNNFNFIQNAIQNDRGYERNISGGFDLSVPTRFAPRAFGLLKLGLSVRDSNRTRDVASITQTPASGATIKLLDNIDPTYAPADNFQDNKYPEFRTEFPDAEKMLSLSHGGSLITVVSPTGDSGSYRAKERVTGGYITDEIHLGERTSLLPGLRFEYTNTSYGGAAICPVAHRRCGFPQLRGGIERLPERPPRPPLPARTCRPYPAANFLYPRPRAPQLQRPRAVCPPGSLRSYGLQGQSDSQSDRLAQLRCLDRTLFPERRHRVRWLLRQAPRPLYLLVHVTRDHRNGPLPHHPARQRRVREPLRRRALPGPSVGFPAGRSARIHHLRQLHSRALEREDSAWRLHPSRAGGPHGQRLARLRAGPRLRPCILQFPGQLHPRPRWYACGRQLARQSSRNRLLRQPPHP